MKEVELHTFFTSALDGDNLHFVNGDPLTIHYLPVLFDAT